MRACCIGHATLPRHTEENKQEIERNKNVSIKLQFGSFFPRQVMNVFQFNRWNVIIWRSNHDRKLNCGFLLINPQRFLPEFRLIFLNLIRRKDKFLISKTWPLRIQNIIAKLIMMTGGFRNSKSSKQPILYNKIKCLVSG